MAPLGTPLRPPPVELESLPRMAKGVARAESDGGEVREAAAAPPETIAGEHAGTGDVFDNAAPIERRRFQWFSRGRTPQISTKKSAHRSSVLLAGVEIAVHLNYIDPLNEGRGNVRGAWIADEDTGVAVESVLARTTLPGRMRIELQGPALSAQADGEQMPMRARILGVGLSRDVAAGMPKTDTPPRVEVKLEAKITDASLGSLAALAGASDELAGLLSEIEGTEAAHVIGDVLVSAVPIVSTVVALASTRRAVQAVRDPNVTPSCKVLAVLRALADATTVVLPLAGMVANMALVVGAVALAKRTACSACAPPTGPPPTGPPANGPFS